MKTLITTLKLFLFLTVLTGMIYPLVVTGIAQLVFPAKANGSMIVQNNKVTGSALIGQPFDSAVYFSPRPSAVSYNPLPSGGSNLGLTNAKLKQLVSERRETFIRFNQLDSLTDVPAEMLFGSASGLDPDISPRAALLQVNRIAQARGYNNSQKTTLTQLIHRLTQKPQLGFLGESRINVLLLNLELDRNDQPSIN